jgi:hypothetical protein
MYRKATEIDRPAIFDLAMKEIEKCVVMCANCHIIKTKNECCGRDKLMSNYDTPEDFLIQNNKSTCSYITLNKDEYCIPEKSGKKIEDRQLILI